MSERRRRRLARTACIAIAIAIAVYVVAGVTFRTSSSREAEGRRPTFAANASKVRSPTPTAEDAARGVPIFPDLFDSPPVASYLASSDDGLTAAVYDKDIGRTSLYDPRVAEDTASIMKVDILATLLAQSQASDSPLTADQQELSQEMIEESNDDDAQDLWDDEGGAAAVNSFNVEVGMTRTTPDAAGYWGLSTTTAADQVRLLEDVAYPNALLTDASRQYELGLMTNVDPTQAWGVSSGVSPGVTVAIKNGWLPLESGLWQINSLGYIDGDGRDYVIAVLSDGNATEMQGIDTIEGLSALIWQELKPGQVVAHGHHDEVIRPHDRHSTLHTTSGSGV